MKTSSYIISAENIEELVKKANQLVKEGKAKSFGHATYSRATGATAVAYC